MCRGKQYLVREKGETGKRKMREARTVKYPLVLSYFPFIRSGVVPSGFPSCLQIEKRLGQRTPSSLTTRLAGAPGLTSRLQWYLIGSGKISRSGISFSSVELVHIGLSLLHCEPSLSSSGTCLDEVMMDPWEPWKVNAPERDEKKDASCDMACKGEVSIRSSESVYL